MIPAIDSYSYHRFFGHHYPGLEQDPGRRMSIEDFLDRAVSLGAAGVSLESCFFNDFSEAAIERLKQQLDGRGLQRVWAWGHPRGLESGANEAALEDLLRHIHIARRIGADVMRICAGGRGTRPEAWADHRDALVPMLRDAAGHAEDNGIVLAVENHLDLYADELVELVETVSSPALGVCFDTANNLRLFEDPVAVARRLAPYARATHVKDVTAWRGDPKTFAFWPSVPIGRGAADIEAVLRILADAGYKGLLALEIDFLHPDFESEDAAVEEGMALLRAI